MSALNPLRPIGRNPEEIRLALPSKGRLEEPTLAFLAACGLAVEKANPRQYMARIPALPGVTVLFQRAGDIPLSVRDGGVDFGITGYDVVMERLDHDPRVLILHEALNYGHCDLVLAVPEVWPIETVDELAAMARSRAREGHPLRIATRFTHLVSRFLRDHGIVEFQLVASEGTLEVAPSIGYADLIADLTTTGTTLHDNRLKPLRDGVILHAQACLIANRDALKTRPEVLTVARQLVEFFEAHLRAEGHYMLFANMRGESAEAIARRLFTQTDLGGLQGPTISRVYVRDEDPGWFAIHIIVRKDRLNEAIQQLRTIGGSGVVVAPVTYIFEEEPPRWRRVLEQLS
ncbi:ATP phosphoribosyltransferase [Candidatus Thermoflexus japonica]|uniref:ATP phosphoribosyltransferase n=1 Tax=Candidatus Thermoflexus japonica TaxID=2035417 RepID=A0A2H5Y422_9CHLR|nr:ATP phosphoribosyltransferase [Candidatus Thermoflexus japonica]